MIGVIFKAHRFKQFKEVAKELELLQITYEFWYFVGAIHLEIEIRLNIRSYAITIVNSNLSACYEAQTPYLTYI